MSLTECPRCGRMLVHTMTYDECPICGYNTKPRPEGITNIGQMEMNARPHGSPLDYSTHISVSGNTVWPGSDSIVLVSGGMDSVTLAYFVSKTLKRNPVIMFFDYGQKTVRRELVFAMNYATQLLAPFTTVEINGNFVKSAIIKGNPDSMKMEDTVVPGRNLLFTSFAVAMAASNNIQDVYIGVQIGDHEGYPDCRKNFWYALGDATQFGYDVTIRAPFLKWTKRKIVESGLRYGVDYSDTYSCYYGKDGVPCGECPSCKVRKESGVDG